jgi:dipeptidyl aminopeptidase/acylaminoacyl peptidase
VLYEMATGQPAYHGKSAASLISAILKDEPRPIGELVPMTPPGLDRIVRACLAKDPEDRWQSAHDLALALAWPQSEGWAAANAAASAEAATYRQLTFRRGTIINARFAPDGRTVIYDAAWEGGPNRIYFTRTDSPETTLPPLHSAVLHSVSSRSELAISLDRHFLGSWWLALGMLAQAPLFGGTPREVAPDVYEADWLPDGNALAVIRRVGLENVVEFPLGNPVFISKGWVVGLRVSPDGRHVAFADMGGIGHGSVLRVADQAGSVRSLGPHGFWFGGVAWKPDGRELYLVESKAPDGATLMAVDLEGRRRSIQRFLGAYVTVYDVAAGGDMLMSRCTHTYSIACARAGQEQDVPLGQFDFPLGKDISDDGRTLLYDEQGVANGGELYTYVGATDGSPPTRLGPGYARELSPDGKWAINIHESRLRLLPRGAGVLRELDLGPVAPMHMVSWHPDGQHIVLLGSEEGRGMRLYIVPIAGGAPRPISPEGVGFQAGAIVKPVSPDGKRVLAMTPAQELRVYSLEDGAQLASIQLEDREEPIRWCGDGRAIFLWTRGRVPARVLKLDLETGERTPWREYPPADRTGVVCSRSVLLTPDGATCVHTYSHMISELFVARGLA